jgi:hypothetical protein
VLEQRKAQMQAVREKYNPRLARERKKQELEEELKDAKWILDYERQLTALQKGVTGEISRAAAASRSPERLHKLDQRLAHLRTTVHDRLK